MKIVFGFILVIFFLTSCKKDNKTEIGSQEQHSAYRPYLGKEHDYKNKDSVVIKSVRFVDPETKTITDYYGDGKSIRIYKVFKNDLQEGKTTVYFPDGRLQEVQYYREGKQTGQDSIFYPTGELRFVYNFENDKKTGWMYRYSKSGHQEFAALYKDDKVEQVIDSLKHNNK